MNAICPICSQPRNLTIMTIGERDFKFPNWDGHEACAVKLEEQRSELETEQQRKAAEAARLKAIAEIDSIFLEACINPAKITIAGFVVNSDNSKAYAALNGYDFANEASAGVVLFGSPGTGKTHMIAGFAYRAMLEKKIKTLVISRLKRLLEGIMSIQDFSDRDRYLKQIKFCDLLVIDDIGTEKLTEWGESQLEDIIDARISLSKPTWATTNLDPTGLKSVLTPRLVSRLQLLSFIKVPGMDQRKIKNR